MDRLWKLGLLPAVLMHSQLVGVWGISLGPSCLFKTFLEFECWACGMTRALDLLCRLEWRAAVQMHPASPLVLALLGALFLHELSKFKTRQSGDMQWLNSR